MKMPGEPLPTVTVTQPKVAFILSLITLAGFVYVGTEWFVRRDIEFEKLQETQNQMSLKYDALAKGQIDLKDEIKSLRETVDGEIRHMTQAMNRLSNALSEKAGSGTQ
jgi:hypothetical protein